MQSMHRGLWVLILLVCCLTPSAWAAESEGPIPLVPTPGQVTMLDLGATKCIPCKMMAPIIAELQKEYAGRASIIFIDVWEHRDQAQRFGIQAIPTQIFFDKDGKEVSRHMGFLDKQSIVSLLDQLGVPKAKVQ
ncbi:MAG: thioredoxin family protein [Desulfobacteraceae bacterium]|nr:thioredoxin family protein [Desulfobacteraceae bacterium]